MLDIQGHDMRQRSSYTVTLAGRLDSRTAREFQHFQEELVRTGRTFLVLDAHALQYVSSAGIASLLALVRRLQGRGAAVLLAPNPEVRLLLEFFAITEYLPVCATEAEAQAYLSQEAARLGPALSLQSGEASALPAAVTAATPGISRSVPVDSGTGAGDSQHAVRAVPTRSPVRTRPPIPPPSPESDRADVVSDLRSVIREDVRRIVREELAPMTSAVEAAARTGAPAAASVGEPEGKVGVRQVVSRPQLLRPEIIRCEQCGGQFRVRVAGRHMCPHCRAEIGVEPDGSVSFRAEA